VIFRRTAVLFHIVGAGPSGLYLAYLLKHSNLKRSVRVFEQNRADVTFGFGVVLSGRALQFLAEGSASAVERLKPKMEHWPNQYIVHRGQRAVVDGSSYSAIERVALLRELQRLCAETGVEVAFEHRASTAADVADCDVLVGADGANSAIRDSHADGFGTCVTDFRNYYAWYGVARPFDAQTLTFVATEAGAVVAHHYRYTPSMSTFVAEFDTQSWDRAGMAEMSEDERRAYTEDVFADTLAGQPLISNRSIWRRWRLINNDHWHFKNIVLIGDALRTAHFSIGSGTRLAMEDAIALWRAFQEEGDNVRAAFARYVATRKPVRDKLNTAVELSARWYEQIGSKMHMSPYEFAHDYLLRTNVMTAERLARESPDFMARYTNEAVQASA
jgi:2-polyprenyl-6-methoxyphenol hydroxylase-like FAD-dependent oxidoreductase